MEKLSSIKCVSAAFVILCCVGMSSCKQAPTPQQAKNEYRVINVSPTDKTLTSNYSASLSGKQNVEIRPQISGIITDISVQEGASVKKGQTLFIIDQVPYKAALQTALANVESAKAGVATAKLTAESKQELYNQKVVSSYDLEMAKNDLLAKEAALAQAKAQEVNARNNLSYTVVKSPVSGAASMIPYRVGALVSPSIATPLVTVCDDSEMLAYFSMAEKQMLAFSHGSNGLTDLIQSMPEVELLMSDGSTYTAKGRIDAISGIIDPQTGAISMRAIFPNPNKILRSGSSGSVILPYQKNNCIVIPQNATYEIQDKLFVYKVVDGKAVATSVTAFRVNNGTEYIIEAGLQAGDIIVAEGVGLLKDGTAIDIKGEEAPKTDTQKLN